MLLPPVGVVEEGAPAYQGAGGACPLVVGLSWDHASLGEADACLEGAAYQRVVVPVEVVPSIQVVDACPGVGACCEASHPGRIWGVGEAYHPPGDWRTCSWAGLAEEAYQVWVEAACCPCCPSSWEASPGEGAWEGNASDRVGALRKGAFLTVEWAGAS